MTSASTHRQGLDLARFIAAFGICVAHAYSAEDDWDGHLSLALFTILTAFLAMQSMQRSGRYPVSRRLERLLLPWLVWSAFYRLVYWKIADVPMGLFQITDPWSLMAGASLHLWFLPFVGVAMFLVEPIGRWTTTARQLALGLAALVAIAVPFYLLHQHPGVPAPLPQWLFATPVYVLGLLMARAHALQKGTWPLLAAAAMTLAACWATGGLAWSYTIVAAALAFEVFWRLPWQSRLLPPLGQAAFGIYLLHPFFLLVVYKFLGGGVHRLLAAVLIFLASWGATVLLRRIPFFVRLT